MIVVGEKVNATRGAVKRAVRERDGEFLARLVREQDEAGATYIDLNVGTGLGAPGQELDDMRWLIDLALDATGKDLCVDSSDPEVLRGGIAHLAGRRGAMLNSVNGERRSLEAILPTIEEHRVPFVALAMDEGGIPADAERRLAICGAIHDEVVRRGIDPALVFFDPLVIPLVTDVQQAQVTFTCLREIKRRFPAARTTLGLSNISHGLPGRAAVNQAFLVGAIVSGLDAAIMDPCNRGMRRALLLGEALAGRDRHCRRYARAHRKGLWNEP